MTDEELAKELYAAFRRTVGYVPTTLLPLGKWDQIGEHYQKGWLAAARKARAQLTLQGEPS